MRRCSFLLFVYFTHTAVHAQVDSAKELKGIRTQLYYGFIFAHSEHVQNTSGAHPRGLEVELIRQKVDTSTWDLCRCYPVKGWSFSYVDFNTSILGQSLAAAYFLEPSFKIGKKGQFKLKGSFGLSIHNKPFDLLHNPTNMSYSTNLNGYLQLGAGIALQVAPQWLIQLGSSYQHISNGGLKEPNKGINWPTASIGVNWMRQSYNLPDYKARQSNVVIDKNPALVVGAFISAKQVDRGNGENFRSALGGMFVQGSKAINRISALNAGVEMTYNNALNERMKIDSVTGSPVSIGALAGHEFLLGKFNFSQQLGVYIFNQSPYYTRLYHRWTLNYNVNKRWRVGFSLKAHKQVADFIDARLSYQISK